MRVVAGTLGGRKLLSPDHGGATRPTTDRVREAMFNSLESLGVIDGAAVLDLYAGSGACGIEALSRQASSAVFVDHDSSAIGTIKANVAELGVAELSQVVRQDAFAYLATDQHFDVAIVDPPYRFDQWEALLQLVNADVVMCESHRPMQVPDSFLLRKTRRYGATHVTLLEKA